MSPIIPLHDLHRARRDYQVEHRDRPAVVRLSRLTLRCLLLSAMIRDDDVDAVLRDWKGGLLLGLHLVLDQALRPGQLVILSARQAIELDGRR